jgi:hypothetical protein
LAWPFLPLLAGVPPFWRIAIPLCSRFDSVLFTPKMFRIASYGDYSAMCSIGWAARLQWQSSA